MINILYHKKFRCKKIYYAVAIKKLSTGALLLQIDQLTKENNQNSHHQISVFNNSIQRFGLHIQSVMDYLETAKGITKKPAQYQANKKKAHPRAYEKWSPEEDNLLSNYYHSKLSMNVIEEKLNRNKGGIIARLKKLDLI